MQEFNGKKLNLFKFLAGKSCYLHNCATVLSEDSLFRMNKGVPKYNKYLIYTRVFAIKCYFIP